MLNRKPIHLYNFLLYIVVDSLKNGATVGSAVIGVRCCVAHVIANDSNYTASSLPVGIYNKFGLNCAFDRVSKDGIYPTTGHSRITVLLSMIINYLITIIVTVIGVHRLQLLRSKAEANLRWDQIDVIV